MLVVGSDGLNTALNPLDDTYIDGRYFPYDIDRIFTTKPEKVPTGYFGSMWNFKKFYGTATKAQGEFTVYSKALDYIIDQLSNSTTQMTDEKRLQMVRALQERTIDYDSATPNAFNIAANRISSTYGLNFTGEEVEQFAKTRYSQELQAFQAAHSGWFKHFLDMTVGLPIGLAEDFIQHPVKSSLEMLAFTAAFSATGGLSGVADYVVSSTARSVGARLGLESLLGSSWAGTSAYLGRVVGGTGRIYAGMMAQSVVDHIITSNPKAYMGLEEDFQFPSVTDALLFGAFSAISPGVENNAIALEHKYNGVDLNTPSSEARRSMSDLTTVIQNKLNDPNITTEERSAFIQSAVERVSTKIDTLLNSVKSAKEKTSNPLLLSEYDSIITQLESSVVSPLKSGSPDISGIINSFVETQTAMYKNLDLEGYASPEVTFSSALNVYKSAPREDIIKNALSIYVDTAKSVYDLSIGILRQFPKLVPLGARLLTQPFALGAAGLRSLGGALRTLYSVVLRDDLSTTELRNLKKGIDNLTPKGDDAASKYIEYLLTSDGVKKPEVDEYWETIDALHMLEDELKYKNSFTKEMTQLGKLSLKLGKRSLDLSSKVVNKIQFRSYYNNMKEKIRNFNPNKDE